MATPQQMERIHRLGRCVHGRDGCGSDVADVAGGADSSNTTTSTSSATITTMDCSGGAKGVQGAQGLVLDQEVDMGDSADSSSRCLAQPCPSIWSLFSERSQFDANSATEEGGWGGSEKDGRHGSCEGGSEDCEDLTPQGPIRKRLKRKFGKCSTLDRRIYGVDKNGLHRYDI